MGAADSTWATKFDDLSFIFKPAATARSLRELHASCRGFQASSRGSGASPQEPRDSPPQRRASPEGLRRSHMSVAHRRRNHAHRVASSGGLAPAAAGLARGVPSFALGGPGLFGGQNCGPRLTWLSDWDTSAPFILTLAPLLPPCQLTDADERHVDHAGRRAPV